MGHPPKNENPLCSTGDFEVLEESEGADGVGALPVRLHRYEMAHRRSVVMSAYLAEVDRRYEAGALVECGSWLLFRWYYCVDVLRLHKAPFCKKHLICPLCAIRRGSKMLRAYLARIAALELVEPGLRPYLVTVTVKNGPDPWERFQHLQSAVAAMLAHRREALGRGRGSSESTAAVGGAGSYEFKMGRDSGEAHPHCHMVWLCDRPPSRDVLRAEWLELTGDSFIVDVRPINDRDGLVAGLSEVFKYALKFSEMAVEDNLLWADALRGRRLVFSFGKLWGIKVPDELTDDESTLLADEPYFEMFYRYVFGSGYNYVNEGLTVKAIRSVRKG
jgi:hypothetical protein